MISHSELLVNSVVSFICYSVCHISFLMPPYEVYHDGLSWCIWIGYVLKCWIDIGYNQCLNRFQVQWLLDMLTEANILGRAKTTNRPALKYLCGGKTAKSVPLAVDVAHSLTTIFRATPTVTNIIAYPQARKTINSKEYIYYPGHKTSNIVYTRLPNKLFVGELKYFFPYTISTTTYELAYINWLGQAEMCLDSLCFVVKQGGSRHSSPPCVANVSSVSPPIVHVCDDDGNIWFPRL